MSYLTISDFNSRTDANGDLLPITEIIEQDGGFVAKLQWQEGNMPTGHKHAIRSGIEPSTWRKMYEGVQPTKSQVVTVTDTCGSVEDYAEVDVAIANLNGNTAEFRMSEVKPHIQSMTRAVGETLIYGDTDKHPERFMGLAPRYNTLDKKVPISKNVISAGGTGTGLTSCYFIGLDAYVGIYPKGSKMGLEHTDKGQVTVVKSDNSMYEAYRDHFKWQCGASLLDWQGCARLCNIKVDDLIEGTGAYENGGIIKMLIKAKNKVPESYRKKAILLVPPSVYTALELAGVEKSSNALAVVPAGEQFKVTFFGIPVMACDYIKEDEEQVK